MRTTFFSSSITYLFASPQFVTCYIFSQVDEVMEGIRQDAKADSSKEKEKDVFDEDDESNDRSHTPSKVTFSEEEKVIG